MTLQLIVSSPHVTEELKAQAHMWLGILQDVARLLDMLMSCQNKVCVYLCSVQICRVLQ